MIAYRSMKCSLSSEHMGNCIVIKTIGKISHMLTLKLFANASNETHLFGSTRTPTQTQHTWTWLSQNNFKYRLFKLLSKHDDQIGIILRCLVIHKM